MIHLSASKACLKLPRSVEDLLRNIGSHFSRSYGRQEKLKEFQIFFQVDIHKILLPSNTRWLSLKACVDRILEQFDPLNAYFTETVFSDPSKTTEEMLKSMSNKFTKIYLEFMSYNLGLLNEFNLMFQAETPLLHKLKPETEKLLRVLCLNFMPLSFVKQNDVFNLNHLDSNNYLPLDQIYLGVQATDSFLQLKQDSNASSADLKLFLENCLHFYLELVTDLKKRFVFEDEIFEIIDIIDPKFAQSFKVKSLNHVIRRFPILKNFINYQEVDNEWKDHALLDYKQFGLDNSKSAEEYWSQVFLLQNTAGSIRFPNLKKNN